MRTTETFEAITRQTDKPGLRHAKDRRERQKKATLALKAARRRKYGYGRIER